MSAPASTPVAAPSQGIPEASPLLLKAAPAIFLLFWSGGFAAGKVGLDYTGPLTFLAVRYALVLLILLPLAFLLEDRVIDWSLPLGLSLLYLIVCNSLIALTLLMMMIRRDAVSRVSALFFLVPPMAALIGWVLLDEQMPPLAWVGLALAAAGVALATRADRLPDLRSRLGVRSSSAAAQSSHSDC